VDKLASVKKLASVTLVAVAIVLAAVAQGWGEAGHGSGGDPGGSGGDHPGAFHDGFRGHQGNLRDGVLGGHRGNLRDGVLGGHRGRLRDGVRGHRGFDRGHFFGGYPYYGYYPPAYGAGYSAPAYWYYCPSYGAYYPNVASCPDAWVLVPAS
jgi:hypothetical protein